MKKFNIISTTRDCILLALFAFATRFSFAQNEFYNDGADVYVVNAGALIFVQGDVINDDQGGNVGRIHNTGNIQLTGNWSNTSGTSNVFDALATGVTTFLGVGAVQTIGGTMDTYFNNLVINKSGAATQEVRLLRNSLEDGVLNLTNDFLNTQTFTFLVANPLPAAIQRTGAIVPNYVQSMTQGYVTSTPGSAGRLARATSNLFPGIMFFPVGNGTRFRPVEITPTSVGNNVYAVQFVNLPTFSTGLHSPTLQSINPPWYHFIERAVAAGSPENIRIYWDLVPDAVCDVNQITLSEWNLSLWADLSPAPSTTPPGFLSYTQKTGYPGAYPTPWVSNAFALADVFYPTWDGLCTVLSADGVNLSATPFTNSIKLNWQTLHEVNNAGFNVERSIDGNNFTNIGWVDGAIDSDTPVSYNLEDADVVFNQPYFYRLKMNDQNGGTTFSNIAEAILVNDKVFQVGEFYPNPSTNGLSNLWVVSPSGGDIKAIIYNALGQSLYSRDFSITSGYNELPFDLSAIADGSYYAIIYHGSEQFVRRFSLER